MNLIIDIGNTVAKIAVFSGRELVEVAFTSNRTLEALPDVCAKHQLRQGILSSVIALTEEVEKHLQALPFNIIRCNAATPLPIRNLYETPSTLGFDRLAAVVGAWEQMPGRDVLVVDAGTCITYELLDANGQYHGGNISPGLQMRFKALHEFTGKLPLVEREGPLPELGKDTETAIRAGVIHGIEREISGYITALKHKYPELLVFLTGGDEFSFDTKVKSGIFADRFLVLKGLNGILNYNNDRI